MTEHKHTPLPTLLVREVFECGDLLPSYMTDSGNEEEYDGDFTMTVIDVGDHEAGLICYTEDADNIVRAVNNHYKLVAALELATNMAEKYIRYQLGAVPESLNDALVQLAPARAALAAIEYGDSLEEES